MIVTQESTQEQNTASEKLKIDKSRSSCLKLVSQRLRSKPYTCALLVKEINTYSSSHISYCLRKLKKAGLIDAKWDKRNLCFVYYNIQL
ncbi:winged helix DNA-binding protein [Aetokthonos hydrillicola]|jgi:predicted MarR family transcription regulator|uniref:winged helix DNA-binding protein n=1 Tax=Aetokthonos hydrillicola TaxID=1550245 RepID=UPI001B11EE18|nr:hypothetical protein [Aetokthonos hydrillicola CCALA 1050]